MEKNELEGITLLNKKHILPAVGPNLYWEVGQKILQEGLKVPVGDEVSPLLHAIYCNPDIGEKGKPYKEILEKKGGIYVFNRNLWTPQGVYFVQDIDVEALQILNGRSEKTSVMGLMKLIEEGNEGKSGVKFSKDGNVRFAPKDSYAIGEVEPQRVRDDGFVIANFGERGAIMLSEIASKFGNKPYLHTMDLDEEFWGYHSPLDFKSKVASISTENDRLEIYGLRNDGTDGRGDVKSSAFGIYTQ